MSEGENNDDIPITPAESAESVEPTETLSSEPKVENEPEKPRKKILLEGDDAADLDQDDDDDDDDVQMNDASDTSAATGTGATTAGTGTSTLTSNGGTHMIGSSSSFNHLIPQIVTPSPFQHHNDSTTSDRYRNTLQRITNSPLQDVEAWEAIMTECMSLYRTQLLPKMEEERSSFKMMSTSATGTGTGTGMSASTASSAGGMMMRRNDELERKLDWVESCHGHLLHYFPYTACYYQSVIEVLLARGALPFESLTGGEDDFGFGVHVQIMDWHKIADAKIERIFEHVLGVKMDGASAFSSREEKDNIINTASDADTNGSGNASIEKDAVSFTSIPPQALLGGMCTSSIDLWLLYIRKRSRDAKRQALLYHSEPTSTIDKTKLTPEGEDLIRDWIVEAYETALRNGASFVYHNDVIWKHYLTFVKSWNIMTISSSSEQTINHVLHSKQKELLRSIYQRIVSLPMTGLDSLWTEYEVYEKAQSEQLATALIAEHMPKYQHARSIYLERNRVYNIHELRMGKFATLPADYGKDSSSSKGVGSTGGSGTGGTGTGSGTGGALFNEEEYKRDMLGEIQLLAKWKRRCAYERSNPERLNAADLAFRVRQCFKDNICAFMRHIEVWHEWSTWELFNIGGGAAAAVSSQSSASGIKKKRNVQFSIAVLTLAQQHLPDCTLLAYAHALILENQVGSVSGGSNVGNASTSTAGGNEAIEVMTNFCNRAGNTLGYVLLQRLVRKYKGVNEARKIFSVARRALQIRSEDMDHNLGRRADGVSSERKADHQGIEDKATSNLDSTNVAQDGVPGGIGNRAKKLVITRDTFEADKRTNTSAVKSKHLLDSSSAKQKNSFITWHLYASHAVIEHRINKMPQVAARIYELGLRKHRTFLATPQYVLQHCALLLELGDEENLRALLMRSIAACDEDHGDASDDPTAAAAAAGGSSSKKNAAKKEKQRPLWDMMLNFEAMVSARTGDYGSLRDVEVRRRHALYGPDNEDVTGGSLLNDSSVGIGMHKISLNDTLIRTDGYDVCSRIVNGLDRIVDTLEVSGILDEELFGTALSSMTTMRSASVWKDDGAGGLSDSSFRRRKRFQTERSIISKLSSSDIIGNTFQGTGVAGSTSGKLLSAKERIAQSNAQNPNTTVAAAVLLSPEWLRDMLLLLPATARNFRGAKAPPHMIEMTLAALRNNPLPTARPAGAGEPLVSGNGNSESTIKRKRNLIKDGDSSDEETTLGSGYGNQFRSRQRAKLMASNGMTQ